MSVILMGLALKGGPSERNQRFVFLTLANFADDAGGTCYPSITTLAAATCQSRRNILHIIPDLRASGWICTEADVAGPTRYTLNVPQLCRNTLTLGVRLSEKERSFAESYASEELSPVKRAASEELSPVESVDSEKFSGVVVKFATRTGEKNDSLYKKNRYEPSVEPSRLVSSPDQEIESSPASTDIPTTKKSKAPRSGGYDPGFLAAYAPYPKRDEKADAEKAYLEARPRLIKGEKDCPAMSQADAERFLAEAAADYARQMSGREHKHIRSMGRWLRQGTYLDYHEKRAAQPKLKLPTGDVVTQADAELDGWETIRSVPA